MLALAALFAAGGVARAVLAPRGRTDAATGAVVMAIGIFVLGAWQQLPIPVAALTRLFALALAVLWAFIAASFAATFRRGASAAYTSDPVGGFAIGTWVAATAVLGTVLLDALAWRAGAVCLTVAALLLGLWYLPLVWRGFLSIVAGLARQRVTGVVLLSTVSTQSLVLVGYALWPERLPSWVWVAFIGVGLLFYALGLMLILRRYLPARGWRLADDWDNTNCIVHGAMSITGLAGLSTGALPLSWILFAWLWALAAFAVVEAIEIARAVVRVRAYGWRRGLCSYHVSQWARNFTFGMLYAFTWDLHRDALPAGALAVVRDVMVSDGQYVVFVLLLTETVLWIARRAA